MSGATNFRPEIEALRGIAAFSVMLVHSFWFYISPKPGIFDHYVGWQVYVSFLPHVVINENSAVVLFFVMSGYVLGLQLAGMNGGATYFVYIIRRIFRIAPAMWVTSIAAFLLYVAYGHLKLDDYNVLIATMFFQSDKLNGPLWSIIAEMWCSVFFPLLYAGFRRANLPYNIALLLALYLLRNTGIYPPLTENLIYFQVGLMAGAYGPKIFAAIGKRTTVGLLLIAFCLYNLPGLSPVYGIGANIWLKTSGIAGFIILAYVVYKGPSAFGPLLTNSAVRFLGRISYSVYLIHFIVLQPLLWTAGKYQLDRIAADWLLFVQILNAAAVIVITITLAALSYRYVERPGNMLGRKITERLFRQAADMVPAPTKPM